MRSVRRGILLGISLALFATSAIAALNPKLHFVADQTKKGNYVADGIFSGGDRSVTAARLKDIRRASSPEGFERVVLDLETDEQGGGLPYFQVQLAESERRYVLSIWGDVGYDFDANRIRKAFAKSAHIKKINVVPRLEDGLSIIEFVLNPQRPGKKEKVEVFRLSKPGRIIMDIL
jgi:hypothetical protein